MSQFLVREKDGLKIYNVEEQATSLTPLDSQMQLPFYPVAYWAPSGRALALVDQQKGVMVIILSEDAGDIAVKPLEGASLQTKNLQWSTKSTFLVTLAPPTEEEKDNMVVWNAAATRPIARFNFPRWRDKHLWPAMKWSEDEMLCLRAESRAIVIMDGQKLTTLQTIATDESPTFELAPGLRPGSGYRFFSFSPEHRDSDLERTLKSKGYIDLVEFNGGDALKVDRTCGMPAAETCEMTWSASGQHCLLHAHCDVDESGQNYYGASRLLLCSLDGSKFEMTADAVTQGEVAPLDEFTLPGEKGLMLQAYAWSPTRDEFVLITGYQPAVASLWSYTADGCKKIWTFPERLHRNTIRWNRFGDLLALGGFGNLAGDLDFWYREDGDKGFVRCGNTKAECTVNCSWAPNGRHFLTAVLAPRMRVDNAVTVWRGLCGQSVHNQRYLELFEAVWRPQPDAPPLTPEEVKLAQSSAAKGATTKKQAYRPPGARGAAGGDEQYSVAARMRSQQGIDEAITRRNGRVVKGKGDGPQRTGSPEQRLGPTPVEGRMSEDGRKGEKGDKGKGKDKGGRREGSFDGEQQLNGRSRTPERAPPKPAAPPLPETGWAYVDTTGKVQGPFALAEMRAWNQHGYFRPELQIRAREGEAFHALKDLYPKSEEAFMVPPSLPP